MIKIDVTLRDFKKAQYPDLAVGKKILKTDFLSLIHSSIMVGRSSYADVMRFGISSAFDLLFRIAMLRANVTAKGGRLVKTNVYDNLDPTEKSSVSFFLGMTIADLISREYLGVSRLVHLGHFKKTGSVTVRGNKHPDLIGQVSGGWVVVEAKGRTGEFDSRAQTKAKIQSQSIVDINSVTPLVHTACQTFFKNKELQVRFDDPEPSDTGDEVNFNYDDFLHYYYAAFIESENLEIIEHYGNEYMVERLDQVGVVVGISKVLLECLRPDNKEKLHPEYVENIIMHCISDVKNSLMENIPLDGEIREPRIRVFDDGIYLEVSNDFWLKNTG